MATVKPVPEGMHSITPHLTVRDCAKAIDFYTKAFGAKELHRFEGPGGLIMHAAIQIAESTVYLNDEFPEMGAKSPASIGGTPVTINYYTADADAVFQSAVAAGAQIKMPIADQFWGDHYGLIEDPFGHSWAIARRIEDLTPEELKKRGEAAMAQMSQGKN